MISEDLRSTKLIIDLDIIEENVKKIRDLVGSDVALMPVIKANGYGHGAVGIAPTLIKCGAAYLAVATLNEAMELRRAYEDYPVFILGHTPDRYLHYVVENNITQTIFDIEQAKLLSELAKEKGKTVKIHIKLDTGFHRLGKTATSEYLNEVKQIFALENIEAEGIFTHLALAGKAEDKAQFAQFIGFVDQLEKEGYFFKYHHVADSIACVDYPEFCLDMIRPGAIIYGMRSYEKDRIEVRQAISFVTEISQLHNLDIGEGLGYDYLWVAERKTKIATLPFGYADGYPRNMRDKGYVIINNVRCPIVGVICMDQCMVDVTDVPDVVCGMEAIIYGDGFNGSMTIEEASHLSDTNKNEIIARLGSRPVRQYSKA